MSESHELDLAPYVPNKNFADLGHRWTLKVGKRHYADVFVWETLEGLYDNCAFYNRGDYVGAYIGYPLRTKSGLFGEIHLWREKIGSGYVAHELMHLIWDWMDAIGGYKDKNNERVARLMGELTRKFWIEFYKRYEAVLIRRSCNKQVSTRRKSRF